MRLDSAPWTLTLQVAATGLALAAWFLFARTGLADKADMPGPVETLSALWELWKTAGYWQAVGGTVRAWALGLLLSIAIGVPVGLLIGRSRRSFESTRFMIDFLRTIPSLALVPLALLLFGQSLTMVIVVCCLATVWPLLIQSIYAGQHADHYLHTVARSFRLSRWHRIAYVLAPEALAFIWPGLRIAATASLLVTIGAELVGAVRGTLGFNLLEAQAFNQPAFLFAYVLTSCALGLMINGGLLLLQRRLLWWHPAWRGG